MTPRDWTLTDQACAADDERHRRWWKHDPFSEGVATTTASDGDAVTADLTTRTTPETPHD